MRVIIYTGKGGTGKTVTSASTAISLADRNYKTLLISSDPAHTLGDAFMLSDENAEKYNTEEIIPNLSLLQVDPINEINMKYNNLLAYMASLFTQKGIDESISYEIAMMPGMTQLFSLLKVEEIVRAASFDAVILDMPASGEALRYLYFPKLVGNVGKKLTGVFGLFSGFSKMFHVFSGISIPSNILQFEEDFFGSLNRLANIITDNNITSIRLVANPDSFSIENAKRALMSASLYGINVDLAIVNKIWPMPSVGHDDDAENYYSKWSYFHRSKVEEARVNFYPLPVKEIPLHSTELAGINSLRFNANLLFGAGENPMDIMYQGKPFSIIQEGQNRLRLVVKVPFTEQKDFDIKRVSGGDIIIKVRTPTGTLANVIPLPIITYNMKMTNVTLSSNNLIIFFEKTL
jgi:arsenite-transporting ATPase